MRRLLALALPLVAGALLASCGPAVPDIAVSSPDDGLRLSTRLVFSTVNEEARPARSVTVRNPGGAELQVTGVAVTGSFALDAGQPTSFTLAPGASRTIAVRYTPPPTLTATTAHTGTLTIDSNDAQTPRVEVTLKGLDAAFYEDRGEPTLRMIANAFGYAGADVINSVKPQRWPIDATTEVISPYWRRVDAAAPVGLVPLARYAARTQGTTGSAGWYSKGTDPNLGASRKALYAFAGCGSTCEFNEDGTMAPTEDGGENQKLLPATTTGITTFEPTGLFGLFADQGRSFSDDGFHRYTDETGTVVESQTHNFRFYPARDANGVTIADTWLVGVDIGVDTRPEGQKNYDYQDYVFLLTNAQPELARAARPPLSGLEFTGAVGGTVTDEDGEGTGFTSVQSNDAGTQYQASQIDLDAAAGVLRLTTTNGTNSGGTDRQENALQRAFDASYRRWSVGTRVVDPDAVMGTQLQHQAVFFGPDNGNFVKLEAEFRDGAVRLVSYAEKNGVFAFADTTGPVVPLGTSVELYLLGDPDLRTVQPAYRIGSGTLTNFGPAYAPSDSMRWFSTQAQAGVLASSQIGQGVTTSPSFVATFDWFRVVNR
jgi:hypothetical protein